MHSSGTSPSQSHLIATPQAHISTMNTQPGVFAHNYVNYTAATYIPQTVRASCPGRFSVSRNSGELNASENSRATAANGLNPSVQVC